MRKRSLFYFLWCLICCSLLYTVPTYAGWEQYEEGWKYRDKETKEYVVDGWKWIYDEATDTDYCYYFENGYLLTNTTTPDGYKVDSKGRWEQGPGWGPQKDLSKKNRQRRQKMKPLTIEKFTDLYDDYLSVLISYMQQENFDLILEEMKKPAYNKMFYAIPQEPFVKMDSDTKGLKIYVDYLYYGDLKDGIEEGIGTMYRIDISDNQDCGYFTGKWHEGAPNGYGEERIYLTNGNLIVNTGNYVDWYQDGDMTSVFCLADSDNRKTFHYKVVDRFPVNIDTRQNKKGICGIVAFPEEGGENTYLTFYDTAQTALHRSINGSHQRCGYWNCR